MGCDTESTDQVRDGRVESQKMCGTLWLRSGWSQGCGARTLRINAGFVHSNTAWRSCSTGYGLLTVGIVLLQTRGFWGCTRACSVGLHSAVGPIPKSLQDNLSPHLLKPQAQPQTHRGARACAMRMKCSTVPVGRCLTVQPGPIPHRREFK